MPGQISARRLEGWLFDVYPGPDGMVLWVQDAAGRPHRLIARYHPGMFVAGSLRAVEAAERALRPLNVPVVIRPSVQRDLMSGNEVPVFRVAIGNPLAFPAAARRLARIPGLTLYNCDIPTSRLFFYEMGLFPLVRCRIDAEDGLAHRLEPLTRPDDLEYDLPPLVVLRLRLISPAGGEAPVSPAHGRRGLLEAGVDGETVVVDGDDPAQCLRSLNRLLARYDPDVILTEWGDAVLLPRLRALAARTGIPLALNRDPHSAVRTRRARSYVTYGQVVHQAGAQMLYGRWHIDLRNSFIFSEAELAGLLEVARLSGIPVQDQARTSTGTAISSMQVQQAVRDGILIPWQKSEPEGFKTGSQLILTDKGGLTYQPLVGLYEQVGELDFSSMYPMMMAKFNISPETIGCACCPDSRVPEINYSVCRKRRGLVPRVLDHLLERRMYYKRRKNETVGAERELYNQRQTALKWCLVTSFGYLGYRNARFGRIEAHEAVTAFSREMLLQAKEVAEARGYRMLHALVDSMWLQRPGATREDYESLAREVTAATGLPIFVEGVYRWLAFLPSKMRKGVGVPNRYMGVFEDGSTKVRGIEVRRSDVPAIVETTQTRMLQRMFACRTLDQVRAALPEILGILEEALVRLRAGEVTPEELVVTTHLSQEVAEYRHNTVQAITARSLDRHGARLHPGEAIQYIITDRDAVLPDDRVRPYTMMGSDWSYDADAYADMLIRAGETVLELFGWTKERLRGELWEGRGRDFLSAGCVDQNNSEANDAESEMWRKAVRDAWNAMADVYDAAAGTSADFYRTEVIGPGLLAACGNVSALKALDLGCGQGYFSRLLASAGASVVGVDISERLIEHAVRREREAPLGIEYVAADAADITSRWPPASFDLVVSCIALQDMADPLAALRAASDLLRPGGRVVILVEHPINDTSRREWERDVAGRKIVLRIDRYFDTGPKLATWKIVDPRSGERREYQFPRWRRTIEQWSELFSAAGFLIARIFEPRPTTEQVKRVPDLDDCYRIPYFLTFELVPVGRP